MKTVLYTKVGLHHIRVAMPEHTLPLGLAELQRDMARGRGLPPVERWNPSHCGDSFMRIARDGVWYHHGTPIGRKELVRLFSTLLRRDGADYFLVTPAEKLSIAVEDLPFRAVLVAAQGEGRDRLLTFTTDVGDDVAAGPNHPITVQTDAQTHEPSPSLHVRHGLSARIARNVFYDLVALAEPDDERKFLGVWSGGVFFPLGPLP